MAGTPYFLAPEVINGKYGKKADIWSCGVTLYVMVFGEQPFRGNTVRELYYNIKKGVYSLPKGDTSANSLVSDACKDLISKMLTVDPKKRISAGECLKHEYFANLVQDEDDHHNTE